MAFPVVVLSVSLGLAGCLDPQVGDEIDPSRVFGNPNLIAGQLPHVEDNPDFAPMVAQFPTEIPYAKGFASGRPIYYWQVPPPTKDFVVPFYLIVNRDGMPLERPIIDVIPGDTGYSPWWRVTTVRITDQYAGEKVWSRESVDLGVRLGIFEEPVTTDTIVTCVVVQSDTQVQVDPDGTTVDPTFAIYRNQRVSWIQFQSDITLDPEVRRMPVAPYFVMQRIDEQFPIAELDGNLDLDGDGVISASNNIFQYGIDEPGYTPAWYPILVRTVPDFVSIDTASTSADIEFDDEDDFVGPVYNVVTSDRVVPPLLEMRELLQNLPIQRQLGAL